MGALTHNIYKETAPHRNIHGLYAHVHIETYSHSLKRLRERDSYIYYIGKWGCVCCDCKYFKSSHFETGWTCVENI